MKKIVKICLTFILTFLFFISQTIPITANNENVYISGLQSNEIKNSEAFDILTDLVEEKQQNSSYRTTNVDDEPITLESVEIIAENYQELEEIYIYQDEYVSDIIVYDDVSSVYVLVEEDHVNNTATVTIDQTTFELESVNSEKISLLDDDGNELVIYEEISDELPIESLENEEDFDSPLLRAASWVKKSGPFHKTTKFSFKVLSWIGTIASGLTLTVTGPLGVVLFAYGVAVTVGETLKPTIHIKYYQERRSDCATYHRETRYYYGAYSEISKTFYEQLFNTNKTPKVTYNYFHSVNPSYLGGACLGY